MAFVTLQRGTGGNQAVRSGTAQANTGQTDWLSVPSWATYAIIELNVTATGGTTPGPTLVHLKSAPANLQPVGSANAGKMDDTSAVTIMTNTTGLANTGLWRCEVGPGIAPADVVNSADNKLNRLLPDILGIQVVFDRTNADETYTYTLTVNWLRV